ncbi:TPA: hypothetical protein L4Y59_003706 [Escherichia coli]|nr:hypothetical protein [Escherichia coli]
MNNTFTISSPSYSIDWSPKAVVEEVLQNVSTIINTQIGTVPYARKLGVNSSLVDSPSPIFIATATREIIQKISEFEPRAIIHSVTFERTDVSDGFIRPKLVIGVRE